MNGGVIATFLFCISGIAHAEVLDDRTYGFSLEVPEGFKPYPGGLEEKDVIHSFILGDPADTETVVIINVKRLHRTFPVTQRFNPAEVSQSAKDTGVGMELQEIRWNGHVLDVIRSTMNLPDGRQSSGYTVHFPLRPEAIEVVVGGLKERDEDFRSFIKSVVGSFHGDRLNSGSFASQIELVELSSSERIQKIITGLLRMSMFAVVVVILSRRVFAKKKTPPAPPPLPPGAA